MMGSYSDSFDSAAISSKMQAVGGLNPDASKWEVKDVRTWLGLRGLQEHAKVFVDNDVNGSLLLRLDKETLMTELRMPEATALALLDEINVQENKMFQVDQWTEDEVIAWITSLGLAEHSGSFRFHNVTGSLLLDLTKTDLIEDLKIDKLGHRQTLIEEIAALRKRGTGAGGVHFLLFTFYLLYWYKVNHARDAEARAKAMARQAELKAGSVESQLAALETKLKQPPSAPPPARGGAKGAVVRGFIDQCTFKPQLNKHSLNLIAQAGGQKFEDRMMAQLKTRESKLKELIKQQTASPVSGEAQEKMKKKVYDFFKLELRWDTSAGIRSEDVEGVLSNPSSVGLTLSDEQRRRLKKLRGFEQYLALYQQFCIKGFVERQVNDLEQRKTFGGKHSDEKKKEMEYNTAAEKYFVDRFKWTKVDDGHLDELVDNFDAYELQLAENELKTFRTLKGESKMRAIFKALQTQAFLQRNEADLRKRELNVQMGWKHAMHASAAAAGQAQGAKAVESFLERYHEDLRSRDQRKLKLVEKVQQDDPNFRECTFSPNLLSSGKATH